MNGEVGVSPKRGYIYILNVPLEYGGELFCLPNVDGCTVAHL